MKLKNDFWQIGLFALAFLLVAWFMISNSGCMTAKRIEKFKGIYCCDSISVQFKEKVVKIPVFYSDSSMFEAYLTCDSIGNIYYTQWKQTEGKYSDLQAALKDNVLTVKNYVTIYDTAHIIVTDTVKFQQANTTTNILTKEQQLRQQIFWCFLIEHILLILIALVYTFFRFKSKIIGFLKGKIVG